MTFVNRRYVRDKILTHAVLHGYETLLMKGQYPAVVLLLDVPFDEVDVNVHPAKYEVRFRRQSDIHEAVARGIRAGSQNRGSTALGARLCSVAAIAFCGHGSRFAVFKFSL